VTLNTEGAVRMGGVGDFLEPLWALQAVASRVQGEPRVGEGRPPPLRGHLQALHGAGRPVVVDTKV